MISSLDRAKYTVVPIAITKEGRWLSPAEAAGLLPEETRRKLPEEVAGAEEAVAIIGDPSRQGLIALDVNNNRKSPQTLDVVFPVLHGPYGEDGTIQGLLEMAGLPYVGCGVLASSCGMDKLVMKRLFQAAGLPVCNYLGLLRSEWEQDREGTARRVESQIGYPCFVKPANLGSSVGISKVIEHNGLFTAIDLACSYDRRVIVEQGLDVREIECAVLGNDAPEASLPGEYVVHDERARFLDYTEKYSDTGHVEFVVPAPLTEELTDSVQSLAIEAFRAVDGAGLARVDFFLRRDTGELLINELNTMPGFTASSGYPKMWAATGLDFGQVVDRLIVHALERHKDKSRNQTSLLPQGSQ